MRLYLILHDINPEGMIMKFHTYFFISLSILFICFTQSGCTDANSKQVKNLPTSTENKIQKTEKGFIHIQLIDKPEFDGSLKAKTIKVGRAEYLCYYDDFESELIPFEETAEKKMIVFPTYSNQVIVRRYFTYFEFQDFLAHKGDSLVISFDRNKPVLVKHSIYKYAPQDFTVENSLNTKLKDSYLITGKADDTRGTAMKFFYDDPNEGKNQLQRKGFEKNLYIENLENKMGQMLLPSMEVLNSNAQRLLDSLVQHRLISEDIHSFYQQKYSNLLLKLKIISGTMDSLTAANEINKRVKKHIFHDVYFNQCLSNFERKYFATQAKWVMSTENKQFFFRNPKESFFLIKNSHVLSSKVKAKMLMISLDKVDAVFHDKIDSYVKLFEEVVTDKILIAKAKEKYQKVVVASETSANLTLVTSDKKQMTIENLLQKKKGKVVYVDFWASWCKPCLEEMKYSKNHIQTYKNKDLEVVFLSLDDNFDKWNKATERLEISKLENSLKIVNPQLSTFMKEHKLYSIPRYMIFDKQGVLINDNAPHPSDLTISKVFDALVKE